MKKRDLITEQFFNCDVTILEENEQAQFVLNGHVLDKETFAKLTGAFDGCYLLPVLGDNGQLEIEIAHDEMLEMMQRTIIQSPAGFELVSNDIFVLKKEYRGLGLGIRSFATEATEARRLGIIKIVTKAAGKADDPIFNGWYLWARAGFQADLTPHEMLSLAQEPYPSLQSATTLHDLMITPEGVAWWKKHGSGRLMEFDLSTGSRHWAILGLYLSEKGVIL